MPNPEEILALLERISNELIVVAGVFHVLILGIVIAFAKGWRPSKKIAGVLLSFPLLSVSVIAWSYGNFFNGAIFSLLFLLLFFYSFKLSNEQTSITRGWSLWLAASMIVFGLFYPHFLLANPLMYLIAAPTGLIPCPTLSLVIGFTLLFNSFNSKKWGITLSLIAMFYGIFGALKLHVYIDGILLVGSLFLLALTQRPGSKSDA